MSIVDEIKDGLPTILRASGWKTAALSISAVILVYVSRKHVLGVQLSPAVVEALYIAVVAFGVLALFSFLEIVPPFLKKETWDRLVQWRMERSRRSYIADQLLHLDRRERQIFAYLLENNIRSFRYDVDGGYAVTLISKKLIVGAQLPGQLCGTRNVPFTVPDHVWKVLVENKNMFQYRKESTLPWEIPLSSR